MNISDKEFEDKAEQYIRDWFKRNNDGYIDELQVSAFVDGAKWAKDFYGIIK